MAVASHVFRCYFFVSDYQRSLLTEIHYCPRSLTNKFKELMFNIHKWNIPMCISDSFQMNTYYHEQNTRNKTQLQNKIGKLMLCTKQFLSREYIVLQQTHDRFEYMERLIQSKSWVHYWNNFNLKIIYYDPAWNLLFTSTKATFPIRQDNDYCIMGMGGWFLK